MHGMGGIGKTTLAAAIYNHISREFGGRHLFLAVQQFSDPAVMQQHLCDLLREMLLKLCGITALESSKEVLQSRLVDHLTRGKSVLLVLDNIWTHRQLEDILPAGLRLPAGSRVLITTRSEEIAIGEVANLPKFQPERVDVLQLESARQLLLLYALPPASAAESSQLDDEVSISRVLHACHGVPLALTVVGKYLLGKPATAWQVCTSPLCSRLVIENWLSISQVQSAISSPYNIIMTMTF